MPEPRIALLNAASEKRQSATSQNFQRCLNNCTLIEFNAANGDLPIHYNYDGFVITGSAYSVLDTDDWIADLKEYVAGAVSRDKPILGICFGHQLLAEVLGGTVEQMDEYELGYLPIQKTSDTPLFDGLDEEFTVFITHQDIVTSVPDDVDITAKTEYGIHGFQQETRYGLQSHPEFTLATAKDVVNCKDTAAHIEAKAKQTLTSENEHIAADSHQVFTNFLDTVVTQHNN